jgi:hypothetical protein
VVVDLAVVVVLAVLYPKHYFSLPAQLTLSLLELAATVAQR